MHPIFPLPLFVLVSLTLALPSESRAQGLWFWRKPSEATLKLRPEEVRKIGEQIWRNECGGTVAGLTSWNRGEDFASLGIGHFIWYPAGREGRFEESWPKLMTFMKAREVPTPSWLDKHPDCPWRSYEEFHAARDGWEMTDLRSFLSRTVHLQTEFIVQRLQAALPKMTSSPGLPHGAPRHLKANFHAMAGSSQGLYAMIDYVNFKGEGIHPGERYRGQGWGLAQVLLEMKGRPAGAAAVWEFSEAAKRVLLRRIQNAPKDESQWRVGWMNRCESYKRPL